MSSKEKRTLVIGDVHGHADRLAALLAQEGVLVPCSECDGMDCDECDYTGYTRSSKSCRVIQLGDLGHFGRDTHDGDHLCYSYVEDQRWVDEVLWGNHDYAVVNPECMFSGYDKPSDVVKSTMNRLERDGRLKMAAQAHGFLITHAGLAAGWETNVPEDLDELVDHLNSIPREGYIIGVSGYRGGIYPFGGILWRDEREELSRRFNQVYGHSAHPQGVTREHSEDDWTAYNIDIGGKSNARLAAIWLPERQVVRVDLDEGGDSPWSLR